MAIRTLPINVTRASYQASTAAASVPIGLPPAKPPVQALSEHRGGERAHLHTAYQRHTCVPSFNRSWRTSQLAGLWVAARSRGSPWMFDAMVECAACAPLKPLALARAGQEPVAALDAVLLAVDSCTRVPREAGPHSWLPGCFGLVLPRVRQDKSPACSLLCLSAMCVCDVTHTGPGQRQPSIPIGSAAASVPVDSCPGVHVKLVGRSWHAGCSVAHFRCLLLCLSPVFTSMPPALTQACGRPRPLDGDRWCR